MAKLFQKSTFLLVLLGLLVLAQGEAQASKKAAASASASTASASTATTTVTTKTSSGVGASENGCSCHDKFTEFMNKTILLLRYYTSKELVPELEALAIKFAEFFFSHLANEKPEVMNKFHGFLQNSVQITSKAVSKAAKTAKAA